MVKRVALLDPSGLRLVGVLAVPVVSPALVGNGWPYPLPPAQAKYLAHGVEWAKRAAAAGSRIPPSAPKDLVNLVVGLRVTGPSPGTAGGLEVDYTAGGRSYVIDTATSVVVQLAPHHC